MSLPVLCPHCGNNWTAPHKLHGEDTYYCNNCFRDFTHKTKSPMTIIDPNIQYYSCRCGKKQLEHDWCNSCTTYAIRNRTVIFCPTCGTYGLKSPTHESSGLYFCGKCNEEFLPSSSRKTMKPTLTIYIGLPGSGKSTLARIQQSKYPAKYVLVNKDEIRNTLKKDGWVWSHDNEKKVIAIRDQMILDALKSGKCAISDDTNLAPKHRVRLEEIAKECGAEVKVELVNTSLEDCIRRDNFRIPIERVGEKVIREMYEKYKTTLNLVSMPHLLPVITTTPDKNDPFFKKVANDESLMGAIICDMDGTLALPNGRDPYNTDTCIDDLINLPVARVIRLFHTHQQVQILYVSGRQEKAKLMTGEWLAKHHLPLGPLHMRQNNDMRKDWVIKGEIFNQFIRDKYNVIFCIDDRRQVIDFWRGLGLTVFDVAGNNF